MTRVVLQIILVLALLYAAACLAAFLLQKRLVYFPGPPGGTTPADAGMRFEDLTLTTSDRVRVHGWLLPAAHARGVVLVCHGNAGSIAQRLPAARAFLAMGLSVLLLDYRGYGRSEGSPSEEGTYRDAEAAYDHLVQQAGFTAQSVIVYGESLGAAVAAELALRRGVAAVILESPFTSLRDIGARAYPFLPVRLLARLRYDNRAKAGRLRAPLLVIHSPQDEVVPFAQGRAVYEAAVEPKVFLQTDAGHNEGGFLRREEYQAKVRTFLEGALAPGAPGLP
jgi:fermentation-respiration switch protein FrsA (DUF1100 family)